MLLACSVVILCVAVAYSGTVIREELRCFREELRIARVDAVRSQVALIRIANVLEGRSEEEE